MARRTLKQLCAFAMVLGIGFQAFAQTPIPQQVGPEGRQRSMNAGPRRQLATIIFAGLGGAVLGLSTLSFYGRPQDKLSNIAIGFAVGVIGGTVYVTYNAATNPQEFYGRTWNELEEMKAQARFEAPPPPTLKLGLMF
jgi:hypothetical protein